MVLYRGNVYQRDMDYRNLLFDEIIITSDLPGYKVEGTPSFGGEVKVIKEETGEEYICSISPRGKVRCNCTGFSYRGRCKHSDEVKKMLESATQPTEQQVSTEVEISSTEQDKSTPLQNLPGVETPKKLRKDMTEEEKEKERIPLNKALELWYEVEKVIKPFLTRYELAGSMGRSRETVHDIDVVAQGDPKGVADALRAMPGAEVVQEGDTIIRFTYKGIMIDITFVKKDDEWGATKMYRTGPRDFNLLMRARAKNRGLMLNEHGLFNRTTGERIAGDTEESIFEALGVPYMTPKQRSEVTLQTGLWRRRAALEAV